MTASTARLFQSGLFVLLLSACAGGGLVRPSEAQACLQVSSTGQLYNPGTPGDPSAPEIPTGFASRKAVFAPSFMVVSAHPLASKAGCDVLSQGGSAVDAAIAAQLVLNLVEPQSSGIGGGAFMLHYNASTRALSAYDGRETAPAAATENDLRWISDTQRSPPLPNARASGRSIGTPGLLHMLDAAHKDAGQLAWKALFDPAIQWAEQGFRISPRLQASIAASAAALARDPEARAYFLNPDHSAKAAGTLLQSPALAGTLRAIADGGINAFYRGTVAQDIVDEIADTRGGITAGRTSLADLANYRSKKREAVCAPYRSLWVCGMPPPSSGGLAVAQALGVLENFDLAAHRPTAVDDNGGQPTVMGVHLVVEALRLAYADRDRYVADSDFVALPGGSPARMLDRAYLRQRAGLISTTRSMGVAQPGDFAPALASHRDSRESGTSHISVVDAQGNAVALTTSIEGAFGSFHMTRGGFLLNNQLTDFSAAPADASGKPIANRLAAGKRPRSSMAPSLVFRSTSDGGRGDLHIVTGSPGGGAIIQFVVKSLVGMVDWGLDAQQANAMVAFGAANTVNTNVGGEHPAVKLAEGGNDDPLIRGLRALGHTVNTAAQSSGLGSIVRRPRADGSFYYEGGADPRREGVVLGDGFTP